MISNDDDGGKTWVNALAQGEFSGYKSPCFLGGGSSQDPYSRWLPPILARPFGAFLPAASTGSVLIRLPLFLVAFYDIGWASKLPILGVFHGESRLRVLKNHEPRSCCKLLTTGWGGRGEREGEKGEKE